MKSLQFLICFSVYFLFIENNFSQTPNLSVLNGGYFQVEYRCITASSTYEIDIPAFQISNLTKDMIYEIVTDSSIIFDHTKYSPYPDYFEEINSNHWKWLSQSITTDQIVLEFQGYYNNWEIGESEWLSFGIYAPIPYGGSIRNVNLKIVASNPAIDISGQAIMCSNPISFNLINVPTPYTTTTWEIKQGTTTRATGNGTTATANNITNGPGEVIFTVHFSCYLDPLTFRKEFWFGKPIINYISGPAEGFTYNTYTFYDYPRRDPLSQAEYTWILNPVNGNSLHPYYDYVDIAFYNPYECYQVVSRANNTCGTTDWFMTNICIYDSYSLYPNPSSEVLTIVDNQSKKSQTENLNTIYTIKIIDYFGNLYNTLTKSGPTFSIPVTHLKDGNYILQINNGEKTNSLQFIVKH